MNSKVLEFRALVAISKNKPGLRANHVAKISPKQTTAVSKVERKMICKPTGLIITPAMQAEARAKIAAHDAKLSTMKEGYTAVGPGNVRRITGRYRKAS